MAVNDFEGLRGIVTGGGSGIGLATAQELSDRGARVIVLDIDVATVSDPLRALRCDVTDSAGVDAAVTAAAAELGAIDVVVANAGIGAQGTVADNDDDEWRRVLDVNVPSTSSASPAPSAPPSRTCAGHRPPRWSSRRRSRSGRGSRSGRCTAPRRVRSLP
jgi:NAD(P)-dependent dehydrogenase (short-subunit alcohol dehydrogenase family)